MTNCSSQIYKTREWDSGLWAMWRRKDRGVVQRVQSFNRARSISFGDLPYDVEPIVNNTLLYS